MVKLLRLPQVKERTGLGRTTIYNKIRAGEFPRPIPLGSRAVAWLESDISDWINERVEASREMLAAP